MVEGVGEAFVAGDPCEHDPAFARRAGDRCGSGIVLAGFSIGVAVRVVPEFREHPSAEDQAESGKTAQDFSARVLLKRRGQLGFDEAGLTHEFGGDRNRGGDAGTERLVDQRQGVQLLGAQRGADLLGAAVQVALPARGAQGRFDLGHAQRRAFPGVGALANTASASREARSSPNASNAAG